MMKHKCFFCIIGTWVVGVSAIAWGVVGLGLGGFATLLELPSLVRWLLVLVGLIGIGFLYYQLMPCPLCRVKVEKMKRHGKH